MEEAREDERERDSIEVPEMLRKVRNCLLGSERVSMHQVEFNLKEDKRLTTQHSFELDGRSYLSSLSVNEFLLFSFLPFLII